MSHHSITDPDFQVPENPLARAHELLALINAAVPGLPEPEITSVWNGNWWVKWEKEDRHIEMSVEHTEGRPLPDEKPLTGRTVIFGIGGRWVTIGRTIYLRHGDEISERIIYWFEDFLNRPTVPEDALKCSIFLDD